MNHMKVCGGIITLILIYLFLDCNSESWFNLWWRPLKKQEFIMQVDSKGDRKRLSWWYESLKGIFRPSFILSTSLHPVQLPYFSFSVSLYLITSCLSPTIPFLFLSSFTKHIVCFSVFTSLSGLFFLRRLPLVLSFFFFLFLFVPVVPCSCPVVGQGGGSGGGVAEEGKEC